MWRKTAKIIKSTSICVEFDNRAQVVDNLTRRSTVFEVLHRLLQELNLQEGNWVFVEQWRGVERPLPPRTRILRVWHAWCNEQRNVTFKLQKAAANQQRFHQHPKKRRRPIVKGKTGSVFRFVACRTSDAVRIINMCNHLCNSRACTSYADISTFYLTINRSLNYSKVRRKSPEKFRRINSSRFPTLSIVLTSSLVSRADDVIILKIHHVFFSTVLQPNEN